MPQIWICCEESTNSKMWMIHTHVQPGSTVDLEKHHSLGWVPKIRHNITEIRSQSSLLFLSYDTEKWPKECFCDTLCHC